MFFGRSGQHGGVFRARFNGLSGRFALMVPSANALQIGGIVVVATGNVVYVSSLVPAAFPVALDDFAAPAAPVHDKVAEGGPVGRETALAVRGLPATHWVSWASRSGRKPDHAVMRTVFSPRP